MPKRPDTPFGILMRAGLLRTGISQGKLGGRISDFEHGPIIDASGVRQIMAGERRLTHELVAKIIDHLDLDWAEAWTASRLLPPEVTVADMRVVQRRHERGRRRDDRQLPEPGNPGKLRPVGRAA